jgi:hypothetical protein
VAKWPRVFRARLNTGMWQLLGAPKDVEQEFRHWAQRIQLELRFPPGETDEVTALLYRLKENGHHVWLTQRREKHRPGSAKVESNGQRVTIYPLRAALIKYDRWTGHSSKGPVAIARFRTGCSSQNESPA